MRQADGVLRARQRDDDLAAAGPGAGAAQHRGGADLLEAEHPEQLAEAGQPLLEQPVDGLERAVASRDAGAAGGDDDVDEGSSACCRTRAATSAGSSLTMRRPSTT